MPFFFISARNPREINRSLPICSNHVTRFCIKPICKSIRRRVYKNAQCRQPHSLRIRFCQLIARNACTVRISNFSMLNNGGYYYLKTPLKKCHTTRESQELQINVQRKFPLSNFETFRVKIINCYCAVLRIGKFHLSSSRHRVPQ